MKHVQRAQIILLSAERLPVLEIAKRVGVSRPMVWRWQQRFAEEGIEGLLRDNPPARHPASAAGQGAWGACKVVGPVTF